VVARRQQDGYTLTKNIIGTELFILKDMFWAPDV
jgi:hypothetical protein